MDYFEIKPFEGFGAIKFGMTREQVSQYDEIYGFPVDISDRDKISKDFVASLKENSVNTSQSDIDFYEEWIDINANSLQEIRNKELYSLYYKNNKCDLISLLAPSDKIKIFGNRIFGQKNLNNIKNEIKYKCYISLYYLFFPELGLEIIGDDDIFDFEKRKFINIEPENFALHIHKKNSGPTNGEYLTLFDEIIKIDSK